MAQNVKEFEAKGQNVEQAVRAGLDQLGLDRDEVIVEVIDEGSRGLLGIGSRDAVVVLKPLTAVSIPVNVPEPAPIEPEVVSPKPIETVVEVKEEVVVVEEEETAVSPPIFDSEEVEVEGTAPADDVGNTVDVVDDAMSNTTDVVDNTADVVDNTTDAVDNTADVVDNTADAVDNAADEKEVAIETVQTLLDKMNVQATVTASLSPEDDITHKRINIIEINGDDLGILIGQRGETLASIQHITRLMVAHKLHRRVDFVVDVSQYRQRREQALTRMAERTAGKVVKRNAPVTLEPMPPNERRIIHMALRNSDEVYTQSMGEGKRRKVRILPKED